MKKVKRLLTAAMAVALALLWLPAGVMADESGSVTLQLGPPDWTIYWEDAGFYMGEGYYVPAGTETVELPAMEPPLDYFGEVWVTVYDSEYNILTESEAFEVELGAAALPPFTLEFENGIEAGRYELNTPMGIMAVPLVATEEPVITSAVLKGPDVEGNYELEMEVERYDGSAELFSFGTNGTHGSVVIIDTSEERLGGLTRLTFTLPAEAAEGKLTVAYSGGALYSAAHYIALAPADLALSAPQGLSGAVEAGESVAVSAKVSGEPVKACLDWRAEGEEYWNKQEISINDGAIEGIWETSGMAAGRYELRLRAEDAQGAVAVTATGIITISEREEPEVTPPPQESDPPETDDDPDETPEPSETPEPPETPAPSETPAPTPGQVVEEDGSVVITTVDRATGAVNVSTTYPDGSVKSVTTRGGEVFTTELLPDGSYRESREKEGEGATVYLRQAGGTEITVVTAADGAMSETVENPDGSVSLTETDAEGSKTVTERHSTGLERRKYEGVDGDKWQIEEWEDEISFEEETAEGVKVTAEGEEGGGYSAEVKLPRKLPRAYVRVPCPAWLSGTVTATINYGNGQNSVVTARSDGEWIYVTVEADAGIEFASGGVFSDLEEGAWYAESVAWAASAGLTSGLFGDELGPDLASQRGLTVTFLYRALGRPKTLSTASPFYDVLPGSYCYEAVRWAVSTGVTTGKTATEFAPEGLCTRAQALTFLYRAAGRPRPENAVYPFTDVPADAYYREAMLWAVEQEITTGTSPTTFSPDLPCTRAEVLTFLYRALPLLAKAGWEV